MAGEISNKGAINALTSLFNGSTLYLGLSTSVLDDTSLLSGTVPPTEPTDASYARKSITFGAPTLVNGVPTVVNTNEINWSAWVNNATAKITYAFITNAGSGTTGDILAWFALDAASQIQPTAGQPVKVVVGAVTVSLD